jgi:hypothetical protein
MPGTVSLSVLSSGPPATGCSEPAISGMLNPPGSLLLVAGFWRLLPKKKYPMSATPARIMSRLMSPPIKPFIRDFLTLYFFMDREECNISLPRWPLPTGDQRSAGRSSLVPHSFQEPS